MDIKNVHFNQCDVPNFDDLLSSVDWVDVPGQVTCECYSYRHGLAMLALADAVVCQDPPHRYDEATHQMVAVDNRKYHKFYGEVRIHQHTECGMNRSTFYMWPTENSVYVERDSSQPLRGRSCHFIRVLTTYFRDPHTKQCHLVEKE